MTTPIMSNLTVVFLVVLGYILKRGGVVRKEFADSMIKLVFYVFLPATLFYSLTQLELESKLLILPLSGFFVALCCYIFAYLIRKPFHMDRKTEGSFIITSGAMNQALFIYPFFLVYKGAEGLGYAAFYDFGQALLSLTLGYYIATRYGRGVSGVKKTLENMLRFPPLLALVFALTVNYLGLYPVIKPAEAFIIMLHNCTTPLIMLSLGIFLEPRISKPAPMLGVIFNRFIFSLCAAAFFVFLFQLSGLEKTTVLIASAAPPAMLTLVYSVEEKLDTEFTANLISTTILIGLLYIPLLFTIL
ncbi:MAG: AEC family transporter [Candidatus Altiarchaeota archaeon]|nr:AEC family transporter [Candidatus Altiarchaeota archaeon]